jgi:hypothetical protein
LSIEPIGSPASKTAGTCAATSAKTKAILAVHKARCTADFLDVQGG